MRMIWTAKIQFYMKILSSQFNSNCRLINPRLQRDWPHLPYHCIALPNTELWRPIHRERTGPFAEFNLTWRVLRKYKIKCRSDLCSSENLLNNSHVSHNESNRVLSLYLFFGVWYALQLINQLSFLFLKFPDVILDCITYGIPHHLHPFPKITRHVMHFLNSRAQHWNLALCLVLQSCDCGAVFLHSFP